LEFNLKQKITKSFIDELISNIQINEYMESEYDSEFTSSSNDWLNTNCPFPDHDDSSPSFGVNLESNLYNCFGCGKTGNIVNLVRQAEGLSFVETIQKLSLFAGLEVETSDLDLKYILLALNSTVNHYLDDINESKFPGGLNEAQFLIAFSERTKRHERKSNHNPNETEWIDEIYNNLDSFIENEDYKKINSLWKIFSKASMKRLTNG
jgi:DNA primase